MRGMSAGTSKSRSVAYMLGSLPLTVAKGKEKLPTWKPRPLSHTQRASQRFTGGADVSYRYGVGRDQGEDSAVGEVGSWVRSRNGTVEGHRRSPAAPGPQSVPCWRAGPVSGSGNRSGCAGERGAAAGRLLSLA